MDKSERSLSIAQTAMPDNRVSSAFNPYIESLRQYGASTLLVVVALSQWSFVKNSNLTPWKGGGFGMFSTVDAGPFRRLVYRFKCQGIWTTVDVDLAGGPDLLRNTGEIRNYPSQDRLKTFTEALASMVWIRTDRTRHEHVCPTDHEQGQCPLYPYWLATTRTSLIQATQPVPRRSNNRQADTHYRSYSWSALPEKRLPSGDVQVVELIEVAVEAISYDRATRTVAQHVVARCVAPGLSTSQLKARLGMPLELGQRQ